VGIVIANRVVVADLDIYFNIKILFII